MAQKTHKIQRRIFLIANNPNISRKTHIRCAKTQLTEDDLVIRFNHVERSTRMIFNKTTDVLVVRARKQAPWYWGFKKNHEFIFQNDNVLRHLFIGNKVPTNIIETNNIENYENIDKNTFNNAFDLKSASSGFIMINYCIHKFPDARIILIGFDFHKEKQHPWHNFAKEEALVRRIKRIKNKVRFWV